MTAFATCPSVRGSVAAIAQPATDAAVGGATLFVLRVVALGLAVGSGILLARLLGTAGFGRYEAAMGWAGVLGVGAGLGADKLVVRETAIARHTGDAAQARAVLRMALVVVGLASAAVAAMAWLVSRSPFAPSGLGIVGLGVVPVLALLRVLQAWLQGLGRVVRSQVPELLVLPLVLLVAVAGLAVVGRDLDADAALWCQVAAGLAALGWVLGSVWRASGARGGRSAGVGARRWCLALLPMTAIAGLHVAHARANVVLLDLLSSPEQVGLFGSANRAAGLVTIGLVAANAALAPAIAALHAGGRGEALAAAAIRSARWASLIGAPVAGVCTFGSAAVLGVFGPGFAGAQAALVVLATAQLVNVLVGPVGVILMMTGHARDALNGVALGATVNIGLDLLLIPTYGATGAAIAAGVGIVIWNLWLWWTVRRRLRVVVGAWMPIAGPA